MMDGVSTLPAPIDTAPARVSTIAQLADIAEETIWLTRVRR